MRYCNANTPCSIKSAIKSEIILKNRCCEKWSRSYHETAMLFFPWFVKMWPPMQVEDSVKFTKVSKELNSRQSLSEDCRLMAALTLLSSVRGAIYFGRLCPSAA